MDESKLARGELIFFFRLSTVARVFVLSLRLCVLASQTESEKCRGHNLCMQAKEKEGEQRRLTMVLK